MLRFVLNILLFFFVLRMLRPLAVGVRRMFSGGTESPSVSGGGARKDHAVDRDLTPYEIEDADYEEIETDTRR